MRPTLGLQGRSRKPWSAHVRGFAPSGRLLVTVPTGRVTQGPGTRVPPSHPSPFPTKAVYGVTAAARLGAPGRPSGPGRRLCQAQKPLLAAYFARVQWQAATLDSLIGNQQWSSTVPLELRPSEFGHPGPGQPAPFTRRDAESAAVPLGVRGRAAARARRAEKSQSPPGPGLTVPARLKILH